MGVDLSDLHNARNHSLYVLKECDCVGVATLGGGDTSELETRLSSEETTLPQMAEQSAVAGLPHTVIPKAEQTALHVLSTSCIQIQTSSVFDSSSNELRDLETQLPLRMTIDENAYKVGIVLGDVSKLAVPTSIGSTTLSEEGGIHVAPARVHIGRVALDAFRTSWHVQMCARQRYYSDMGAHAANRDYRWCGKQSRLSAVSCLAACAWRCSTRRRQISQPSCPCSADTYDHTDNLGKHRGGAALTVYTRDRAKQSEYGQPYSRRHPYWRGCVPSSPMAC